MRVVDDLAGEEAVAARDPPSRIIGLIDSPIDSVAEAELAREVNDEAAGLVLEVARSDAIDQRTVVGRREFSRDGIFHVEALAKNQGLGSTH